MKYIFLCFIVLLVVFPPQASECAEIDKVDLGDGPWPPYTLGQVGREADGGLGVELVREIYRRLDIKVNIELYPWKRVLKMAEAGQVDGPTLLMKNPEREKYLVYTIPVFEGREVLFYSKKHLQNFSWDAFEDLSPYTIGLINGYIYGEEFLKAADRLGLKLEYAVTAEVNFQKLHAGRIDLVMEDPLVAGAIIRKNGEWIESITFADKPVTIYPYHMALSKKSPARELIPKLNLIIEQMRADGSIDHILGYYP